MHKAELSLPTGFVRLVPELWGLFRRVSQPLAYRACYLAPLFLCTRPNLCTFSFEMLYPLSFALPDHGPGLTAVPLGPWRHGGRWRRRRCPKREKVWQGELHRRRAILVPSIMPAHLNSGQRVD